MFDNYFMHWILLLVRCCDNNAVISRARAPPSKNELARCFCCCCCWLTFVWKLDWTPNAIDNNNNIKKQKTEATAPVLCKQMSSNLFTADVCGPLQPIMVIRVHVIEFMCVYSTGMRIDLLAVCSIYSDKASMHHLRYDLYSIVLLHVSRSCSRKNIMSRRLTRLMRGRNGTAVLDVPSALPVDCICTYRFVGWRRVR